MTRMKIFAGNLASSTTAADKFNEWIEKNSNAEIVSVQYQQARYGDHSILVVYEEKG